jgi:hypothetical protein
VSRRRGREGAVDGADAVGHAVRGSTGAGRMFVGSIVVVAAGERAALQGRVYSAGISDGWATMRPRAKRWVTDGLAALIEWDNSATRRLLPRPYVGAGSYDNGSARLVPDLGLVISATAFRNTRSRGQADAASDLGMRAKEC